MKSQSSVAFKADQILYEDNHLLIVHKTSGMPVMSSTQWTDSLETTIKAFIKQRDQKPGNVFLGVVHRLDRLVSGIVVFAKSSKALKRLNELFKAQSVEKTYVAMVEGELLMPEARLEHWLLKDEKQKRTLASLQKKPNAKLASLTYSVLYTTARHTLVKIKLHTGRKHQIRAQFAALGHPIVGDKKYGARTTFHQAIALHGQQIVFKHPAQNKIVDIVTPIPTSWEKL